MNSTKVFFLLLITLAFQTSFAQKDGYWDKTRATTEEVTVSARNRIIIKTQDFPEGTTEVVFRITLLDKNQQMAGSLVSECVNRRRVLLFRRSLLAFLDSPGQHREHLRTNNRSSVSSGNCK